MAIFSGVNGECGVGSGRTFVHARIDSPDLSWSVPDLYRLQKEEAKRARTNTSTRDSLWKRVSLREIGIPLVLGSYGFEALAIEIDEMFGIVFCARDGATLEARAGGSGAAKAGGGGDELHHLECDFFIAAQGGSSRDGIGRNIAHGNSPGMN